MGVPSEKARNTFERLQAAYSRLAEAGDGLVRSLSDADVSDLVTLGVQITGMANGEQLRREDARRDFEEGP